MAREIEGFIERARGAGYQTGARILSSVVDKLQARGELPSETPTIQPIRQGEDRQLELFQPYAPITYKYDKGDAVKFIKLIDAFERYDHGEEIVYIARRSPVTLTPRFASEIRHTFGGRFSNQTRIVDALEQIQEGLGLRSREKIAFSSLLNSFNRKHDLAQLDLDKDTTPDPPTISNLRKATLSDLIH